MAINGVTGSAQQPLQNVNNIAQDMQQVKAAPKDPTAEKLAAQQLQASQPQAQTQQVTQTKTDSDGDTDGSKGYSKDPAPTSQTLTPPWVGRNFNISG